MRAATLTSCLLVQHWYCKILLHLGQLLYLYLDLERVKMVFFNTVSYFQKIVSVYVAMIYFYTVKLIIIVVVVNVRGYKAPLLCSGDSSRGFSSI